MKTELLLQSLEDSNSKNFKLNYFEPLKHRARLEGFIFQTNPKVWERAEFS